MTARKIGIAHFGKRCICVVLSLMLALFSVPVGTASAANGEDDANVTCTDTISYVSIGDSFTSGFGLDGMFPADAKIYDYTDPNATWNRTDPSMLGYEYCPKGSYPDLIAEELKSRGYDVNHSQLGQSAMRVDDLRVLLDEDYALNMDSYTKGTFCGETFLEGQYWTGKLDKLRATYRKALTDADLISYDLGKNNFGAFLTSYLLYGSWDVDMSIILGEEDGTRYYELREVAQALIEECTHGQVTSGDFEEIDRFVDGIAYALWGFEINFDATLDEIRELNPDADIVYVLQSNISSDMNIEVGGITIPMGTIYGALIDIANTYAMTKSDHRHDIFYADANLTNGNTFTMAEDIVDYDLEPTSLTEHFKECCDYCIGSIRLRQSAWQTLSQSYETIDQTQFEDAMLQGYDSIARIMQYTLNVDPLPATGFLQGDSYMECMMAVMMNVFNTAQATVIDAYEKGATGEAVQEDQGTEENSLASTQETPMTTDEVIAWLESSPSHLTAAYLYFRSGFSWAWLAHPNEDGHEAIADAVLCAWDHGVTARQAYKTATVKLVIRYAKAWKTFRDSFRDQLKASVREHYAERGAQAEEAIAALPEDCTDEQAVDALVESLDLQTAEDVEELYSVVEEAEELANQQNAHVHSMSYHPATLATCTEEGSTAYWQCEECGEMFLDYYGNVPIESAYTVPALGHHWRTVPAIKFFRFTVVPSYTVCTTCGEKHYD